MFTYKVVALMSVSLSAASLFLNESEGITSDISQGCYRCLCHVNTYCMILNECEHYCGPFNISREYWEDAGKITLPNHDAEGDDAWKACAKNYFCAQKIIEGYMKRFSKDCNGDGVVDCFDYMMINSNGGADCSQPLNQTTTGRIWMGRYEECLTARLLP